MKEGRLGYYIKENAMRTFIPLFLMTLLMASCVDVGQPDDKNFATYTFVYQRDGQQVTDSYEVGLKVVETTDEGYSLYKGTNVNDPDVEFTLFWSDKVTSYFFWSDKSQAFVGYTNKLPDGSQLAYVFDETEGDLTGCAYHVPASPTSFPGCHELLAGSSKD